jgi:hypothetical protein
MRRKSIVSAMLLAVLISACGTLAAPTIDAASVQNTAQAAAFTQVAQTQEALPTNTLIPPTEVPTETLAPSPTLETLGVLATPTILLPTNLPTFTPLPPTSSGDPCNKPLLSWQGPSASFTLVNETKPQGKIILLMSVLTKTGECGYLHIYSDSFTGPAGMYSAAAYVDGKKSFKVFGAFPIQALSWKIIVRNDAIVANEIHLQSYLSYWHCNYYKLL